VLIRASGTEPIIRVIAESTSQARTGDLIGKGRDFVAGLVEGIR
jgi:phosphomannomutase